MPNLREHCRYDKKILGREYERVHIAKDHPGLLLGKLLPNKYGLAKHRLIGHNDPWFNLVIPPLLYPDDPVRAVASAFLHDALDEMSRKATKRNGHR